MLLRIDFQTLPKVELESERGVGSKGFAVEVHLSLGGQRYATLVVVAGELFIVSQVRLGPMGCSLVASNVLSRDWLYAIDAPS